MIDSSLRMIKERGMMKGEWTTGKVKIRDVWFKFFLEKPSWINDFFSLFNKYCLYLYDPWYAMYKQDDRSLLEYTTVQQASSTY